ncbi:uncharacterized protein LOC107022637 [Solanum pennellii]|uniref:Uncharacterized protein LOC107022637 n=1 Tax=Solanum pennellii TaxID=28526 RepID=A0ABM1H0M8_SOLPN|nr:uncharacterized protein LOC107022637 [Solanum pennellii]
MVHAQQIERTRLKRKNKDDKRARPYDEGNKDRVYNPKPQGVKGGGLQSEKPNCAKCGKRHMGKCLVETDNCFSCGRSGHLVKDFPMSKTQGRESYQTQASGLNCDAPRKNHFYALNSKGDQEDSPNVVTDMLQGSQSRIREDRLEIGTLGHLRKTLHRQKNSVTHQ